MAKPKQGTLLEKFGFADPDLSTPKHDAIMSWLDDNSTKLFREYSQLDRSAWDPCDKAWAWNKAWVDGTISKHLEEFSTGLRRSEETERNALVATRREHLIATLPKSPPTHRVRCKWEHPVTTDRQFIVGYVDMLVSVGRVTPFINENGNWDFQSYASEQYFCEVKPTIPSLGELFRQLQTYASHINTRGTTHDRIVVVSPDARHRARIEAQGFLFIEAPKES